MRNNPLTSFLALDAGKPESVVEYLNTLDISMTRITSLQNSRYLKFPSLTNVNISYTSQNLDMSYDLDHMPSLAFLDLRHTTIKNLYLNAFKNLTKLSNVYASNPKLCCKRILPQNFNIDDCFSSKYIVSSCMNLIDLNFYTIYYLIAAGCILFCNGWFLIKNFIIKDKITSDSKLDSTSIKILFKNLYISNLCFGVYVLGLSVADQFLKDEFVEREDIWLNSTACFILKMLYLSSTIVCSLTTAVITIYTFIFDKLCCKHYVGIVSNRSALVTNVAVWIIAEGFALWSIIYSHNDDVSFSGLCSFPQITHPSQSKQIGVQLYIILSISLLTFDIISFSGLSYLAIRHKSIPLLVDNVKTSKLLMLKRVSKSLTLPLIIHFLITALSLRGLELNISSSTKVYTILMPFLLTPVLACYTHRVYKQKEPITS